jgi:hypothetical protein
MSNFKKAIFKFINIFFSYMGFYYILKFINRKKIRVLMYHGVDEHQADFDLLDPYVLISTKNFEKQIKYLSKTYNIISLYDLISHIKNKISFLPNSVVITFDDGLKNNYINAFPILQKYNTKATIFLVTGYITKDLFLSWEEIGKMADAGILFGCHTYSHPVLTTLNYEEAKKEIVNSKNSIEANLGKKNNLFAYPYGEKDTFDLNVKKILINNDFLCALSTIKGLNNLNSDLYELKRICSVDEELYFFKLRIEGFEVFIEKIYQKLFNYFKKTLDKYID